MLIVKIRDFVIKTVGVILSLIKAVFLSKLTFNSKSKSYKNENLVILGNGPSLTESLQNKNFLSDKKLLCVNYFGRTEEYQELKPSFYVITSLEYFFNEDKEDFAIERRKTLKSIASKTQWPLVLFVPAKAKRQKDWKQLFSQNKNISIFYFNTTPIEGFNFFTNFMYSKNWGMPRPHNVLIPSLILAINMKFSNIFIAGADHSWLQEIQVDQDNEVLLSQKHFYDKQAKKQSQYRDMSVAQPMYHGGSRDTRKLHEVLEKFYYTFQSYWKINGFAEAKNIKIYNVTPISYIDAFERLNITTESK